MGVVIDASLTLAWFLEGERTRFSEALFDQVELLDLWAPAIWRLEVPNALLVAERRKRIGREARLEALDRVAGLGIRIDTALVDFKVISALAERRGLSTYDASYLECALRQGFDLVTLDRGLADAASAEGVNVQAPGRSTASQLRKRYAARAAPRSGTTISSGLVR
jgi:predicted nucleic acid-binding protein